MLSVSFVRSGGLVAAPGLTVRGRLELGDGTGRVTCGTEYVRDVPAAEAAFLTGVVRSAAAGSDAAPTGLASRAPDAHQFTFEISSDAGERTIVSGSAAEGGAVALLRAWAEREASAIVAARMQGSRSRE